MQGCKVWIGCLTLCWPIVSFVKIIFPSKSTQFWFSSVISVCVFITIFFQMANKCACLQGCKMFLKWKIVETLLKNFWTLEMILKICKKVTTMRWRTFSGLYALLFSTRFQKFPFLKKIPLFALLDCDYFLPLHLCFHAKKNKMFFNFFVCSVNARASVFLVSLCCTGNELASSCEFNSVLL